MSLDYPYYEELCRRKHRAAWWWIIGDRLYYLGLLPALCSVAGEAAALLAGLLGYGWGWLLAALGTFIAGVAVFFIGGFLKAHAYKLGERDGISAGEVYDRGRRQQSP
ncbi:MAG: hypothetical protein U0793_26955 [Gemmataceae bacterium]